ncbi:MAG: TetR family transcriptional regulator C-terminal domain-containing protein [Candidatus Saccharibacteria bacterium]|nr:TetR family transcriptional regulator C-terminal domain-containing protein [Pseudorhodobacter sp.]
MISKPRASYIRLSPENRRAALIDAALLCIAEGGIAAFKVDKICTKAGVSRGLVTHHFGSMDTLLTAAYAHIYQTSLPAPADLPQGPPQILALLDHFFSPAAFNRHTLNIWLTFWAQISNHPVLRVAHRHHYPAFNQMVADALRQAAPDLVAAPDLARTLICLIDGLSLQHCIDPDSMPAPVARQACVDFLAANIPVLA